MIYKFYTINISYQRKMNVEYLKYINIINKGLQFLKIAKY